MMDVREAVATDAPALGRLHVQTWREAYWGVLPDQAIARETPEGRTRFWRAHLQRIRREPGGNDENVVLAEDARGKAVGFVWTGAARGRTAPWDGEIFMLYVLQNVQRQGVGRLLMAGAARSLVRRGFFRLGLWVLEDNGPARAFYESLGGQAAGGRREPLAGGAQPVAGYVWDDPAILMDGASAAE